MKRTTGRQMSAKDKAFELERIKLRSIIQKKNEEIGKLIAEVNQYKAQAESWEKKLSSARAAGERPSWGRVS